MFDNANHATQCVRVSFSDYCLAENLEKKKIIAGILM